ncbi:hypothetical protein K445DRAFT_95264 [Daldinia sp. EC12]|nr:hypothetical protein K445DRAFT_95264 [Daldinia sp. EC12]
MPPALFLSPQRMVVCMYVPALHFRGRKREGRHWGFKASAKSGDRLRMHLAVAVAVVVLFVLFAVWREREEREKESEIAGRCCGGRDRDATLVLLGGHHSATGASGVSPVCP